MKKILILIIFMYVPDTIFAQSNNIWKILGTYLKNIGEIDNQYNIIPKKLNDGNIMYSFIIVSNNQSITDPDYTVDNSDRLQMYQFGTLNPQAQMHLLVACNGKWMIINMSKSLRKIMMDGVKLCNKLRVNNNMEIDIFTELINLHTFNEKKLEQISGFKGYQ